MNINDVKEMAIKFRNFRQNTTKFNRYHAFSYRSSDRAFMARADIKERLIGESKTKERMFTGDLILADKALHLGLVDHVVPKGEGLAYAKKLAEKIHRFSLPALAGIKKAINECLQAPLSERFSWKRIYFEQVFQTEEIKEGVQAFLEEREPSFSNR